VQIIEYNKDVKVVADTSKLMDLLAIG